MSKLAAAPKVSLDTLLATLSPQDLYMARLEMRAAVVTLEESILAATARILNLRAALTKIETRLQAKESS